MAKRQAPKSGGTRNPERRNGKAWGKNSPKTVTVAHPGHNKTGRTKPSGNTVAGHALRKLNTQHSPGYFKASRNTQHRKGLRQARKACTSVALTDVSLRLVK